MFKLIGFFIFVTFGFGLITMIYEGEGGPKVTRLTSDITSSVETIPVQTTLGWTKTGMFEIDGEVIEYSNKTINSFLNCDRGEDKTDAVPHAVTSKVYSSEAAILNNAMGFNISKMSTDTGITGLPTILLSFTTRTIPKLIMFDFSPLKEGEMQYFRWILFCFSGAFLISMALIFIAAFGGIFAGVLGKLTGR